MGQQFSWEQAEAAGEVDVAELQEWYKKFVVECPSGTLFLHEFKRFFKVTGDEEATQYVEGMFRAFDKNGVRQPEGEGWARPLGTFLTLELREHPRGGSRFPVLLLFCSPHCPLTSSVCLSLQKSTSIRPSLSSLPGRCR